MNGRVSCTSFDHLDFAFNEYHSSFLSREIAELRTGVQEAADLNAKEQLKFRIHAYQGQQAVFRPAGKRMPVSGIVLSWDDGTSAAVQNAHIFQAGPEAYWEPVYVAKPSDSDGAATPSVSLAEGFKTCSR